MRLGLPWKLHKGKGKSNEREVQETIEPVKILTSTEMENGNKTCLMVEMSKDFYREAIMFLHDKGYMSAEEEQEGMALLLEFGLSEVNQEELERNGKNMREISYAALKFKCYELYKQNQAIVFGLRVHVQENKALKKKIAEKGIMVDGKEDEWELWDDEHLDVLYNRYVFNK